jgi:predicted  nucleic acid-binding Zn-ribbon protein
MNTENNQFVTKQDLKDIFEDFFKKIITHVDQKIDSKIDALEVKLKTFMMQGFTAMGERMDYIEERIDSINVRLKRVEEAVVPVRRIRG